MNEERDSQLSAMFDGELPASECELLSRRLGRDELLRARWSRYAAIGAVLRADPTVVVHGNLARRVSAAVAAESAPAKSNYRTVWQWVAGSGVAAAVAGVAILMLRTDVVRQDVALTAFTPSVQRLPAPQAALQGVSPVNLATRTTIAAPSYVVPPMNANAMGGPVPVSAALANYVVAHSEYSSPLARPHLLSALVASDLAQDDTSGPANPAAGPSGNASH